MHSKMKLILLALLKSANDYRPGEGNTSRQIPGGGLELQVPDLISVTTLKTDENSDRIFELTWGSSDYLLYPLNAEPLQPWGRPYARVIVDTQSGTKAAFPGGKSTIEILGKWGFREVFEDSGADISEGGAFSSSDTTLTVTDGTKFSAGQTSAVCSSTCGSPEP